MARPGVCGAADLVSTGRFARIAEVTTILRGWYSHRENCDCRVQSRSHVGSWSGPFLAATCADPEVEPRELWPVMTTNIVSLRV